MDLGIGKLNRMPPPKKAPHSLLEVARIIMQYPPPEGGKRWAAGGVKLKYTTDDVAGIIGCSRSSVVRYWRESRDKKSDLAFVIRAIKAGIK